MKISEVVARELDAVVANGGKQQDGFSNKAIRAEIEVLEKGDVFQVFGKVFSAPIRKDSDITVEYKQARVFRKKDGKIDPASVRVVNIYPSFFNKTVVEVNEKCERTGRIARAGGAVAEKYMSFGSVQKGFDEAVEGKVIEVTGVEPVMRKRYGTENQTQLTKVYTFDYADVELPAVED